MVFQVGENYRQKLLNLNRSDPAIVNSIEGPVDGSWAGNNHYVLFPAYQDDKTMFSTRNSVKQVEEGCQLAPKFDESGLIPVITTDFDSGELLMHGYMNREALTQTIQLGEAVYWSRSREQLWHKGATSGLVQSVQEMRIDDDQDAIWLRVKVAGNGASCHVGYRSCFYRSVPIRPEDTENPLELSFTETEKVFDPQEVYGDAPNPTKL